MIDSLADRAAASPPSSMPGAMRRGGRSASSGRADKRTTTRALHRCSGDFRPDRRIPADKGYDADAIREEIASANIEAVIPARAPDATRSPMTKPSTNGETRSSVFNKLKNWRRVATRYHKTRESYLGFVTIAAVKLWIPFVHER